MSKSFYLFPCSCGSSQPIEVSQAGSEIKCPKCGNTRNAPTMIKIKQLEQVEQTEQRREETGILRSCFLGSGVFLFVLFLVLSFYFAFFTYPQPADVLKKNEFFDYGDTRIYQNSTPLPLSERTVLLTKDELIDYMLPFDLFRFNEILKSGPNFSFNFQVNFQELKYAYYTRVAIVVILCLLGVVCIVISFFLPKRGVIVEGWSGSEWNSRRKKIK
ncbi:MAG: hypothetical protein LBQ66_11530 [Planctomycetaceae bacterium]|nr:hypothetical protein [Planctomycetaceae bacterium]